MSLPSAPWPRAGACGEAGAAARATEERPSTISENGRSDALMGSSVDVWPWSSSLQLDLLVRRREQVPGHQSQPRLGDTRPVAVENGHVVDRREQGALVHELLDAMQDRLAPLSISLDGLFLEQALDVGRGTIGVGAAGGHECLQPRGRVAVGAEGEVHEGARLLFPELAVEGGALHHAQPGPDPDGGDV